MGRDVAVIVATFGDDEWKQRAARAAASAGAQSPAQLITFHDEGPGASLARARNLAAEAAGTEWLCFLDADDELEPGYLDALAAGSGDLRAPAVRFVPAGVQDPALWPAPELLDRRHMDGLNPCVIGTWIRRATFHEAGGFWQERAWEDWSLFRRAWLLGAQVAHHPAAVYRAFVATNGRNSTIENPRTLRREILRSHAAWRRTRKAPR